MKVNVSYEFKDFTGKVIPSSLKKEQGLSLREVMTEALLAQSKEEPLTGENKLRFFDLACLINKCEGGELELKTGDISLIKERIGRVYLTIISGQAWKVLEGETW